MYNKQFYYWLQKLLRQGKCYVWYALFSTIATTGFSQSVLISDQVNDTTGSASAVLQAKSTTKGFLPPVMTQAQRIAIASPAKGLLVYQSDGTEGLYYYRDTSWTLVSADQSQLNVVTKTTSDTIKKTDNFILASNNITLVLPAITSADNGLSITIKNIGIYTDLVTVLPNGSGTIDSIAYLPVPLLYSYTLVANNGSWYAKNRVAISANTLIVSWASGWKTVEQAIEFLDMHMWDNAVIQVESGTYPVSGTININLPYTLTIQGSSYGTTTLAAASGLAGNPMFSCATECYFKMLQFDATSLSGYGNSADEDAIHFTGAGEYHEVKDCNFDHFNKAIIMQNNEELWFFESDISNAVAAGVEVAAGSASGLILKTSEVDFLNCAKGINLLSGVGGTVSVTNCGFYNGSTSIGINYIPATFTAIGPIFISNNTWNNLGTFISGFDFSRSDGRDASAAILGNVGMPNQQPSCGINVLNNTTSLSLGSSWKKVSWSSGTQTSTTSKFTVGTNRLTYQPTNHRDLVMWISGNAICTSASNRTINIGIVKNGVSTVRYGETTVRLVSSGQPFQWSTVVYISNVAANDYFEIWTNLSTSGPDDIVFQDINWFTDSR